MNGAHPSFFALDALATGHSAPPDLRAHLRTACDWRRRQRWAAGCLASGKREEDFSAEGVDWASNHGEGARCAQ